MLTYTFSADGKIPLYEQLYRFIRDDIISGNIGAGEKLPSKRALAQNLEISRITVESAYAVLVSEGYIRSEERRGYFAEAVTGVAPPMVPVEESAEEKREDAHWQVDVLTGSIEADGFPFSVWSRLMRRTLSEYDSGLLDPIPRMGVYRLRRAIASHLRDFRGMRVSPEQILIGAGAEYLYMMISLLLGRDKVYAMEEPGYGKVGEIYTHMGAKCVYVGMDSDGVMPDALRDSGAEVLHISPAHHFPTGVVTTAVRRGELLEWAAGGRYIIEDDYDSEFRFAPRPIPPLQTMDNSGRVIFVNTFSKTISPSLRIGYAVLPQELCKRCGEEFGNLSCTVSAAEQYTLAAFIEEGYFEKHLNRMRRFYRGKRDRILRMIEASHISDRLRVRESDSGLHFLLEVDIGLGGEELREYFGRMGVRAALLSDYFRTSPPDAAFRTIVVNYSGVDEDALAKVISGGR